MKLAICALLGAAATIAAPAAYAAQPAPAQSAAPQSAAPQSAAPQSAAPKSAAATPAPGGRNCFRTHDIQNHTIGDDKTLYIRVLNRDVFRIGMSGACLAGAMPTDPLVMREPPGMNIVCHPIDMDVSISKSGFRTPCIVDSITKLTPAEVNAMPKKLRP